MDHCSDSLLKVTTWRGGRQDNAVLAADEDNQIYWIICVRWTDNSLLQQQHRVLLDNGAWCTLLNLSSRSHKVVSMNDNPWSNWYREMCLVVVEGNINLNRWGWNPYLLLLILLHLPPLGLTFLITIDCWIYKEGFRSLE